MLHQQIDQKLSEKAAWALRRQLGIPNNKKLHPQGDGVLGHGEWGMEKSHQCPMPYALCPKSAGGYLCTDTWGWSFPPTSNEVAIDPSFPELKLPKGVFSKWIKTFTNVDEICVKQLELRSNSSLIPQEVIIHGYIWEVETMSLRRPYERLSEKVNTAEDMGKLTKKPTTGV